MDAIVVVSRNLVAWRVRAEESESERERYITKIVAGYHHHHQEE